MHKAVDAFRSIGEVSRLVGVATHVLRYWETQFPELRPVKRQDGRRYYRPDDVRLAAGLCQALREDGLTIRGAKKLIAADRGAGLRAIGAGRLGDIWTPDAGDAPAKPVSAAKPRITAPRAAPKTAMPLFPDLSPSSPDFLLRLSAMAAALRDWPQDRPLPRRASSLAQELAQAAAAHSAQ